MVPQAPVVVSMIQTLGREKVVSTQTSGVVSQVAGGGHRANDGGGREEELGYLHFGESIVVVWSTGVDIELGAVAYS